MATYPEIQMEVRRRFGYTPKTCWIAHVKAIHGLTRGISPNRIDPHRRKHPCPPNKRADIEEVLRYFKMI
ncbi:MAG: hypothetical protein K6T61_10035 [Bryobacteraceae bacterium]|nr:hypothetical protein [Bryobacteraceae bacterium]